MCTAATYKTKDFYFGRTLDYEFSYGDEKPSDKYKVGDEIEAYILKMNDGRGNVLLSAKRLQTKLKAVGFNVIIKQIDGLYKCQVGAFRNKSNAEDLLQSVKSKGFDAFLIYQ